MKSRCRLLALLLVAACLAVGFASLQLQGGRPDAVETLRQVQQRYRAIQSFSADFRQVYSGHNVFQEESGILLMKRPAKMYWEYKNPRKKVFVSDGSKTYFYVPEDRQVVESELSLDTADTPLLFLFGNADVEKDFEVSYEQEDAPAGIGNFLLRLTPRQPRGDFSRVLIEVNPDTKLIERLRVVEPIGNQNEYFLSDFRENVAAPDSRFKFKIPPGTEVIRQ